MNNILTVNYFTFKTVEQRKIEMSKSALQLESSGEITSYVQR